MQYWHARDRPQKNRLLTVRGGYHGDTFGAMAVCDPVNGMHSMFAGLLPEHIFVARPQTPFGESTIDVGTLEVCIGEEPLGTIDYQSRAFENAASIQEYELTAQQLAKIQTQPVRIVQTKSGVSTTVLAEDREGRFVRADQFVYRSNEGETSTIDLYARRFGQPALSETLTVANDPVKISQYDLDTQETRNPDKTITLPIGSAIDGVLDMPASVTTDDQGRATLPVVSLAILRIA